MKMIILNGSPKANSKQSNTEIFIQQFTSGMKANYEIKYIAKEEPQALVKYIKNFDTILIVMPLYIHAMPSGVMALIEHMEEVRGKEQALGFIVQAGFPESAQEKYLCDYLEVLAQKLKYHYLGTVVKGECAFIYKTPERYTKLYQKLNELGREFEETRSFNEKITKELAQPYTFDKVTLCIIKIVKKLGLMDRAWNNLLKENQAMAQVCDRPFLREIDS